MVNILLVLDSWRNTKDDNRIIIWIHITNDKYSIIERYEKNLFLYMKRVPKIPNESRILLKIIKRKKTRLMLKRKQEVSYKKIIKRMLYRLRGYRLFKEREEIISGFLTTLKHPSTMGTWGCQSLHRSAGSTIGYIWGC